MERKRSTSDKGAKRQKDMARASQKHNEERAAEYLRKGGRKAKYKEVNGAYVFDGYE